MSGSVLRLSARRLVPHSTMQRKIVERPHTDPYLYEQDQFYKFVPPRDPTDPNRIPIAISRGKLFRYKHSTDGMFQSKLNERPSSPDFCPGWHGIAIRHGAAVSVEDYQELKAMIQNRVPPNVWVLPHDHLWYVWGWTGLPLEMRKGHGYPEIMKLVYKLMPGTVLFSFVGAKMAPEVLQRVSLAMQVKLDARCKVVGHGFTREPYMAVS